MNSFLTSGWQWCRRYLSYRTLLGLAAVAFVVGYGDNSVFDSIEQDRIVDSLRTELSTARDSTLHYRNLNSRLTTDRMLVEQVVREQYGMKRANEDVYTFEKRQQAQ